jgi:hypothetical protein|tara:strand:+ start:142 stop:1878 length:1737 start_codon:yes stop_codon:yes gene_type:complete
MKIENIIDRVSELYDLHDRALPDRNRFRNILNGGSDGIRELLGNTADTTSGELPAPNLLLSALDRIAQKIGRVPNLEIPLAVNKDSVRAKDRRDKLERIVNAYDEHQKLDMQLPQVGRWLPGYGFAVWTIKTKYGPNGVPYPCAELRDPYDCYPGYYGVGQDPHELAIIRRVPPPTLVKMYPELKPYYDTKNRRKAGSTMLVGTGNMNSNDEPRWETQKGGDVIVEYMEETGTYVVHPGANKLLDFIPNPLKSGPQFVVAKRFSFDKLQGQFDQVIGLMSAMAKINIMSVIAMEDAVFTETNVIGELESGQYRKGRHAINYLSPGTQVVKPVNNLPYQLFDQVSRLERQLRVVAGYPVQDDAISPNSFVTGRGLEELQSGVGAIVREYHTILGNALEQVDMKRLEYDELMFGDVKRTISGIYRGSIFEENYTPDRDIKGAYKTVRKYGAMASFDEPQKIITGLQLLQAGIIDRQTMQEEMDGLDNLQLINDRITKEKAERVLFDSLLAQAQQGNMQAMTALSQIYKSPKDMVDILNQFFAAEQEAQEEQQAMMQAAAMAQQGGLPSVQQAFGGVGGQV